MLVVVKDRQQGKTRVLVQWLLEGQPLPYHMGTGTPIWNRRIITCHGEREAARLSQVILFAANDVRDKKGWNREEVTAASQAVWSLLHIEEGGLRGRNGKRREDIQYAVDDLDWLLDKYVSPHLGVRPALVTINGEYRET